DRFDLELNGFELTIPANYLPKGKPVQPLGPLVITTSRGSEQTRKAFKLTGPPGQTPSSYRFVLEGSGALPYRPGDELRVELPVDTGDPEQKYSLVWAGPGPAAFQFGWLRSPPDPKLVRVGDDPRTAPPAPGVKLSPIPASGVPAFPALFPYP